MACKKKDDRTKNWTFILYPESAPDGWRDILDDLHVPWVESPLHDRDINATGENKKPHIHIVFAFAGNKSFDQIKEITDSVNSPIPKRVENMRGMIRYLTHCDNPEKAQYLQKDIVCHCGFDVTDFFISSRKERYEAIHEMTVFIKDNHIFEFSDFMDIAYDVSHDNWYPLLCDNSAMIINMVITSERNKYKRKEEK